MHTSRFHIFAARAAAPPLGSKGSDLRITWIGCMSTESEKCFSMLPSGILVVSTQSLTWTKKLDSPTSTASIR